MLFKLSQLQLAKWPEREVLRTTVKRFDVQQQNVFVSNCPLMEERVTSPTILFACGLSVNKMRWYYIY